MNIQFKKGVLELCVLAMLDKGDRYGYEIAQVFSEKIKIADGTVYPILRRLSAEAYVSSYLMESSGGPPRKYYTLTEKGRTFLGVLKEEWDRFTRDVNEMIYAEIAGEEIE